MNQQFLDLFYTFCEKAEDKIFEAKECVLKKKDLDRAIVNLDRAKSAIEILIIKAKRRKERWDSEDQKP